MPKRIAAYFLFALGVVIITFFRHYTGELIPSPWIFFLVGIAMFIAGYFLLRYSSPMVNKADIAKLQQMIADLKSQGEKIPVDLNSCEVRSNDYREINRSHGADSQLIELTVSPLLNQLMNHLDGIGDTQNVQQSVIVYSHSNSRTGQTERFVSPIVPKDKVTLSFYLDRQKQTTLYVDKADRRLYYFDLEFLRG